MPGTFFTRPILARRFTPDAPMGPSWPVHDTTTRASTTLGSTAGGEGVVSGSGVEKEEGGGGGVPRGG